MPVTSEPISNGAVLVKDGVIRDVGEAPMLMLRYPQEEIQDYGRAALMPGMIDLYARIEASAMRGLLDDVPFASWAIAYLSMAMKMEQNDWNSSALIGGLNSLESGITTIGDISSTGASFYTAQRLGLRSVIYREVGAVDRKRVDYAMRMALEDIHHWQEQSDTSRTIIGIGAPSIYNTHPIVFSKVSEVAVAEDLPVAMPLAASREEESFVRYGSSPFSIHSANLQRGFIELPPWLPTGVTPVNYALNWGAFESSRVMVIHSTYVNEADLAKMREYKVNVCACPRANAQLGNGVAPVDEFLRAGLNVGLGTGSPAATNSTDFLSEMRIGMLLQRVTSHRRFFDAKTMIELATIGGARVLGIDDKVGSLEIGKAADIIAVNLGSYQRTPISSPESIIVNTCSVDDVVMTMVAGKTLYDRGEWHVDVDFSLLGERLTKIRQKLKA